MKNINELITILGPTAVGKTKFAVQLASYFGGEIISADSRQVFKGMDIGTGKDLDDYQYSNSIIESHLIDIVNPNEEFDLYKFSELFAKSYQKILNDKKLPFLVGGTGLYLSSILQNYSLRKVDFNSVRAIKLARMEKNELIKILLDLNTKLHNTTDTKDKERIIKAILIEEKGKSENPNKNSIKHLVIGLNFERETLKKRIRERLKYRLNNGMIEEVELLIQNGLTHERLRFFGLEYKFISMYLCGELNYNDMNQKLASSIIKFSKRQMTWFRKMEKEGVKINWVENLEFEEAKTIINNFINK